MRVVIAIALIVATAFAAYAIFEMKARRNDERELQQPWPMALGSLEALRSRYPPETDNPAATRLIVLAAPLGIDFHAGVHGKQPIDDAISTFVLTEVTRADDNVDPPPPEVADFLHQHDADFAAIRTHLLANRLTWRSNLDQGGDGPIPNLTAHIRLARCLIARALTSRDTEDLHATWRFALDLWRRPEEISRLIALAETTMIDASMRKLPAAPWREELRTFDVRRAMIEGFQAETYTGHATYIAVAREHFVQRPFGIPFAATYAAAMRRTTFLLAQSTSCAFNGDAIARQVLGPDPPWQAAVASMGISGITNTWMRLERFVAQREATDRILAIKSGRWTPELERSACSDGTWIYADGALRFSREIPPPQRGLNVPLTYSAR
jgi:hypothetical protein